MDAHKEIQELLSFLESSPTSWHAVENITEILEKHGFKRLREREEWKVKPGKPYYVVRNDSSLCAFILPKKRPALAHIIAAHTDSAGLKLKPNAEYRKDNMILFGVEPYGSPLLTSWFNRDLGIAGRVLYTNQKSNIGKNLVQITDYPISIPQLAPHLTKEKNGTHLSIDKQKNLIALAALDTEFEDDTSLLEVLLDTKISYETILSFDLFLYPLEKPQLIGNREIISSYRIDNLAGVHAGLNAITQEDLTDEHLLQMVVFWDNEEIGSETYQGAKSSFLNETLERITYALTMSRDELFRLKSCSFCISVDMSHAAYPNYPDTLEPQHTPLLDNGIVIKHNAQQRYATDGVASALITHLCEKHGISYQTYISNSNIRAGTTVGPFNAMTTGIKTADIGGTMLSMHSCRELMSCVDHLSMCQFLHEFLRNNDSP